MAKKLKILMMGKGVMDKLKKFYEFKNVTSTEADLYIYGEIVSEKSTDWWTGEVSKTDVDLVGFKEELDNIGNVQKINMYINSPGGDVFVASTMVSMLKRKKEQGVEIDAYVDGLSASAASFLMMVADIIYLYKNSTVMIHKPSSYAFGNANDMQKVIDTLNKVEESVMLPMYLEKSKVDESKLHELIDAETWFTSKEMAEYFNVTILDEEKTAVACVSKLYQTFKNMPQNIKTLFANKENLEQGKIGSGIETPEVNDDEEKKVMTKLNLVKEKLKMKERI